MKLKKSDERKQFERAARFECDDDKCHGKPATRVVQWGPENDYSLLCDQHALQNLGNSFEELHSPDVEISNIECWDISVEFDGRRVTRIGVESQIERDRGGFDIGIVFRFHRHDKMEEENTIAAHSENTSTRARRQNETLSGVGDD